jgi:Tfp pilus assembly protein PilF
VATLSGDKPRAVQSYEVLLMLDQHDPVDARTNLAQAYLDNEQLDDARLNILRALEIAPTYERAQDILLRAAEQAGRTVQQ